MYVTKASGEKEEFDVEKIRWTCLKAGASKQLVDRIVKEVEAKAYDGITTREILHLTLKLLEEEPEAAIRYDLKRAIMNLGPTGFPFEKFMAEVLQNYGYETKVGEIVNGKCVSHEIDIIAEKEGVRHLVECKYHNTPGNRTGLEVVMYTYARFLDLGEKFNQAWLICNTKCTTEAEQYGKCVGVKVTSWNYPNMESLEEMVEKKKLYPITILRSVTGPIGERLFQARVMLAKDLLDHDLEDLKRTTGLPQEVLDAIRDEARKIIIDNKND
jgi:predicted RecB family endonuclease